MSSFQILTCYRAPTPWAARGLKRAEPTPTRAPGRPKTSLTCLPSEDPHAVRVCRESNPDLPIHSPARYLCATAAGNSFQRMETWWKWVTGWFSCYPRLAQVPLLKLLRLWILFYSHIVKSHLRGISREHMSRNKGTCKVCIDLITSGTAAVIQHFKLRGSVWFYRTPASFQWNVINVLISYFTSMYISWSVFYIILHRRSGLVVCEGWEKTRNYTAIMATSKKIFIIIKFTRRTKKTCLCFRWE